MRWYVLLSAVVVYFFVVSAPGSKLPRGKAKEPSFCSLRDEANALSVYDDGVSAPTFTVAASGCPSPTVKPLSPQPRLRPYKRYVNELHILPRSERDGNHTAALERARTRLHSQPPIVM